MSEDEKRRQLAETLMRIRELDRTSACLQARLQDARRAYGYLYEGLDTPNVLIKPTGEEGRFDTAFGPVSGGRGRWLCQLRRLADSISPAT